MATRLTSLDACRGFVIVAMTFVNYLGGMPNVPHLLEHEAGGVDGFTLADLVFPSFLLLVGLSIPLAYDRRVQEQAAAPDGALRRGLLHITGRTLSLLLLGVAGVESGAYSAVGTGLQAHWWWLAFYLCLYLVWRRWSPSSRQRYGRLPDYLRWAGMAGMTALLVICRLDYGDGTGLVPIRTSWWGILGMIGWSFLPNALVWYLLARRWSARGRVSSLQAPLLAVFVGQVLLYTLWHAGKLGFLANEWLGIAELFGSHAALVMAGVIAGQVALEVQEGRRRLALWAGWALVLYGLGSLLRPWQVANKMDGTASWTLLTGAVALAGFWVCYAVIDLPPPAHGGWRRFLALPRWSATALLAPIGVNAMLAYFLPDVCRQVMNASAVSLCRDWGWGAEQGPLKLWNVFWPIGGQGGTMGLLNAALLAAFIAALTWFASRRGWVLKL